MSLLVVSEVCAGFQIQECCMRKGKGDKINKARGARLAAKTIARMVLIIIASYLGRHAPLVGRFLNPTTTTRDWLHTYDPV